MNKSIYITLGILPMVSSLFAQESKKIDPTASRELIRQWVQTERLVSEEKNTWKVEKQNMQDLLDLYQKELSLLNEEIAKAGSSAELEDERKGKLESELKDYRSAQQLLVETLAGLLPRVQGLVKQLPAPLHEELAADIDLLNSPEAMKKPREVLKSVLNVLTTAGRFNRSVTLVDEVRDLDNGTKMSVRVLYLGLARAYFAANTGDVAGIGIPGKDGWQWEDRSDIAGDVRGAIAVYQKDKQPQLIELPVSLQKSN